VGWKARKSPAVAGVFFLDFPFYRTYQELLIAGRSPVPLFMLGQPPVVKDNAFYLLSKLRLFDNHEFSNRLCRSDEECAHERDYYYPTHETIIGQPNS
jgi:succinylglutamate desuccinylase